MREISLSSSLENWIGERIKYVKDKGDIVKKVCFKEKNNPRQVLKHLREVG